MDSSALLDAAVRSRSTSADQEMKISPTPVIKSKKTSITAKLKSPAPISRAKKLSLDKTTAEKGVTAVQIIFHEIFTVRLCQISLLQIWLESDLAGFRNSNPAGSDPDLRTCSEITNQYF